ncbi:hypothetical protein CTAYLR_004945 [Chrysophaeum taylorii]|uniref:Uncharacterized protein n=1 Tax=Chrysophaeum taylorii TaxID=2483200 RepID=A0AAD7UPD8_9STRA|nr:hypothetical protein CTAYLR_004945 [Chrysophaeum taylorii]
MGGGSSRLQKELEAREAEVVDLKARLAACDREKKSEKTDIIVPFTFQTFVGSAFGYVSGYAFRMVGKLASLAVGSTFIMLQGLSYLGYVNVGWRKEERLLFDDEDEDDKLWREFKDVLAFNLPAGTGFTGGLLYGLNFNPAMSAGVAASAGLGARFLLPRVALGGTAATGLPGLFVAAKKHYWADDDFGFDGLRTLEDPEGDPDSVGASPPPSAPAS